MIYMNTFIYLLKGLKGAKKLILVAGLVFFGLSSNLSAETISGDGTAAIVTGTVVDKTTNEPLAGVNIQVKGEFRGVFTEIDGTYSIDVENDDILVFSFVGYKRLEVPVNGQSTINVQLEEDLQQLDELVVVGYGLQRREAVTGSIASIDAGKIEQVPSSSFESSLQGNIAGVQLISADGAPGSNTQIRVRGIGSITASSSPLYVVDGVIMTSGSVSNLNSNGGRSTNVMAALNPK